MRAIFSIALFFLLSLVGYSETYYVPDDYGTIQAAIDASSRGDTIIVRPGTYKEKIDMLVDGIVLKAEEDWTTTKINGEGSGTVVTFYGGIGSDTVLEGFCIRNGNSDEGGGVHMASSSPTITGCLIGYNIAQSAGGGMYITGGSPIITDCLFWVNEACTTSFLGGGGIYMTGGASPTITNCDFRNNTIGGGMYIYNSSPTITQCLFLENTCVKSGGAIYSYNSSPIITKCKILNNLSDDNGGGIYIEQSSPTLTDCNIQENKAQYYGGGIFNERSATSLLGCNIRENSATKGGGMASESSPSPVLSNCFFSVNYSSEDGGAMFNVSNCAPDLINCTLYGNSANKGGGIYSSGSFPTVSNCILWNDSPTEITDAGGSVTTVTYSCVQGGHTGTGNIDSDPLFVDQALGDFHLQYTSPCIDAGTDTVSGLPAEDFEGDPRSALGTVDMGADEYYYHLYHKGDVVPGSPIDIKVIGYPTAPITLYLGSGLADPPYSTQHGDFYLNWPPLWQSNIGTVPGDGVLVMPATVPSNWTPGSEHPLQALVGPWGGPWTRLTNMDVIVVE